MEQGPLGKPDYGRIQYVDGLRAIACLIVLCAHLLTLSDQYAAYASGCGKIGVWFFMMISGYCSVKPYLDGKKIRAKQLPKYYLKKIIKVYPLYIVSLGLAFALDLIDLRTAFLSLILAGTWGHFWFMPVILKFYLIFPLVLFIYDFLKSRLKKYKVTDLLFAAILLVTAIVSCLLFPYYNCPGNSIMIRWYAPVFIMGILLAVTEKHVTFKIPFFDLLTVFAAFAMLAFTPAGRQILFDQPPSGWLQNKYLLMGGLWFTAMLGMICADGCRNVRIRRMLSGSRFLNFISEISFEIYLLHYIFLVKIKYIEQIPFSVKCVIIVALCVGLGYLLDKLQKILTSKIASQYF